MKTLVYYETKKIWKRKATWIIFSLMLLCIIAISFVFVSDQAYYGEDGALLEGLDAISEKRNHEHALAGPLDSQRLQKILQDYQENYVNQNYDSNTDYQQSYIKNVQPYWKILDLIRGVYTPYTDYLTDLATFPYEQAGDFYEARHNNVRAALESGSYTAAEKENILDRDSQISIPFEFDHTKGWETLLIRAFSLLFMLLALATCIMISPIISYEYQIGTDAILLPAKQGRGATACAKIVAGWIVTSIVYLITVFVGVGVIAATFGVRGWNCDFQILSLYSFYDLQIWQVVLYGIGINYIVILSVMAFTMLLSSICKTPFTTVIISTLCTVAPMFFPASQNAVINHFVALLPAKAVMTYSVFSSYDVCSIGKLVITLPYMILLVAIILGALELQIARRKYCRHQVT